MDANVAGLILNLLGSFILLLVSLFGVEHRRVEGEKWTKKYWWIGWRPFFKISPPQEKSYWKIKWTHCGSRDGAVPPQHQWNVVGFLYMLIGFLLQLMSY